MVTQRYQFESNSQRNHRHRSCVVWCLWSHKDTNLKAIHNCGTASVHRCRVFMVTQRYQFESNSQQFTSDGVAVCWCLWSHKDTNLKAIHNISHSVCPATFGVYGHTKIPIWKQFTTRLHCSPQSCQVFMVTQRYQFESNSQQDHVNALVLRRCLWSHKDTNLKAIHNTQAAFPSDRLGVYGHTKIPIWKQFTTLMSSTSLFRGVYGHTKIPIWKQFTTRCLCSAPLCRCLWSHKDTNLKAIHNKYDIMLKNMIGVYGHTKIPIWKQFTTRTLWRMKTKTVFMVTQRYQFESNSQHSMVRYLPIPRCLWSHKDTNLKAIHNGVQDRLVPFIGVYGHTKIPIWKQFTT